MHSFRRPAGQTFMDCNRATDKRRCLCVRYTVVSSFTSAAPPSVGPLLRPRRAAPPPYDARPPAYTFAADRDATKGKLLSQRRNCSHERRNGTQNSKRHTKARLYTKRETAHETRNCSQRRNRREPLISPRRGKHHDAMDQHVLSANDRSAGQATNRESTGVSPYCLGGWDTSDNAILPIARVREMKERYIAARPSAPHHPRCGSQRHSQTGRPRRGIGRC